MYIYIYIYIYIYTHTHIEREREREREREHMWVKTRCKPMEIKLHWIGGFISTLVGIAT